MGPLGPNVLQLPGASQLGILLRNDFLSGLSGGAENGRGVSHGVVQVHAVAAMTRPLRSFANCSAMEFSPSPARQALILTGCLGLQPLSCKRALSCFAFRSPTEEGLPCEMIRHVFGSSGSFNAAA